jgi:hypothetical protein
LVAEARRRELEVLAIAAHILADLIRLGPFTVEATQFYAVRETNGPDYSLAQLTRDTSLGLLEVYVGEKTSLFHKQRSPGSTVIQGPVRREYGKAAGTRVEWHSWTTNRDGRTTWYREAIVNLDRGSGRSAHIFISARDRGEYDRLCALASRLRRAAAGQ